MKDLFKKALAEVVGTFVLVFFACGVAALTCTDHAGQVGTALAFGLVIVAMAYTVGRVSGCHINPAVSLGCLLTKRMTVKEFVVYVVAQLVGGFVGAVALFGILKWNGFTIDNSACNLPVAFTGEFNAAGIVGALLVEMILTCIFVYVILNVTDGKSEAGKKAGLIIGLTLTLVHLIGIPLTGTSVNPARSIATALGAAIFGNGAEALKAVWIFIVGPLLGAVLAALLYKGLNEEKASKAK